MIDFVNESRVILENITEKMNYLNFTDMYPIIIKFYLCKEVEQDFSPLFL